MARISAAAAGTPVGAIQEFPGNAAPRGWVEARGDVELSRSVYARLWAFAQASGNLAADEASKEDGQFGPGDGSTTFTTPDYRGLVRRGWDNGRGVDVGRGIGTYQADDNKSHGHNAQTNGYHGHSGSTNTTGNHRHAIGAEDGYNSTNGSPYAGSGGSQYSGYAGNHSHSLSINGNGNHSHTIDPSGGSEVKMKNAAVLVCIKH